MHLQFESMNVEIVMA